ncbi:MAG: hypothetical protein K2J01_04490 [Clostridiales bacterium]|nr:hypothetical protein [Clostridiales bacterium]
MKTVYWVLGAIGSGKSIISDYLFSEPPFKSLEYLGSDLYKKQFFDYDANKSKIGYRCADDLVFYRLHKLCISNVDFIFEFCPTNRNKLNTIKAIFKKYGYSVIAFFIGTDNRSVNRKRCSERENAGADPVDPSKVLARYDEALFRIPELLSVSTRLYLVDNSDIDGLKLVAYFTKKKAYVLQPDCVWLKKLNSIFN